MATKYETPYDRYGRKKAEVERVSKAKHEDRKAIAKVQPGAPYYQPNAYEGVSNEAPDVALVRAKAQGEYMKSQVGDNYQRDEGIFADTVRAARNLKAGKRGKDIIEYGDPALKAGASKAGTAAVISHLNAEKKRESRGMKAGGTVKKTASKASSRADGIAQKGKTKGRMI
jgi:hypothetical protein